MSAVSFVNRTLTGAVSRVDERKGHDALETPLSDRRCAVPAAQIADRLRALAHGVYSKGAAQEN